MFKSGSLPIFIVLHKLFVCFLHYNIVIHLMGGVTRPCARARQAKRVLTQGRRGVQGRTGASRDKLLKMT